MVATSKTFRNKINEPETNSKIKNIKRPAEGIDKIKCFNMKPNTAIYLTFQKLFRINTC